MPFVIWAGTARVPTITGTFNDQEHKTRRMKLLALDIATVLIGAGLCVFVYLAGVNSVQAFGAFAIVVFLFMMVQNRPVFAGTALVALLIFQPSVWSMDKTLLALDRNYFGVLKVYTEQNINFFYHGTTLHGAQPQKDEWKFMPVTYYSPGGPASDLFAELDRRRGEQRVAGLGLGVGSIACYKARGREFDFYEIDRDVVAVAEDPKYFSYLTGCGSPYKIVLGDARLKIEQAPDHSYDMIFIDTFSSDNIPVHIMTKEAFVTYLEKLKAGGIIGMNISNRYLDLRPVLASIAGELGLTLYYKYHKPQVVKGEVSELYTESLFVVMAEKPETIAGFAEDKEWKPYTKHAVRAWTDDYANIVSSFMFLQPKGRPAPTATSDPQAQ